MTPTDVLREARHAVRDARFADAIEELDRLRDEGTDPGSPEWYLLRAMALWRLGRFMDSRDTATVALESYRDLGDVDGEMRAGNVAAAGEFALGALDTAQRGFERAMHLAEQLKDRQLTARCANNLGNVAYYRGRHGEALSLYQQASGLFERVGSLAGMIEGWHNTGIVLRDEGDLDGAKNATDRASDAAARLGDQRLLGMVLCGRGETDALRGDPRLGFAHVRRSLDIARGVGDPLTEIEALRVSGMIARLEHRSQDAIRQAQGAVARAAEIGNPWMIGKAEAELAAAFRDAGREEDADAAFGRAAEAFSALGARSRVEALETERTRG